MAPAAPPIGGSDDKAASTEIQIEWDALLGMVNNALGNPIGAAQDQTLRDLLSGDNKHTLRILYMGNSRVARPIGFAFDGVEEIAFDSNRLAGNGFVVPLRGGAGGGSNNIEVRYLNNGGNSTTQTPIEWQATDETSLLHSFYDWPALKLLPGRTFKMGNFGDDIPMLAKTSSIVLTVQYLVGPGMGRFEVAEVESSNATNIVNEHPALKINCEASQFGVGWTDVTLPPMIDPSLNRSFILRGVSGTTVIYRVNAVRDVPGGIAVSEMAIGSVGYSEQANERVTARESWKAYVAAYRPDIVIWQYANNQTTATIVDDTKELMNRVEEVNPDVVHIITPDHPTPRQNWQSIVSSSHSWADALAGHHDAIVIDPTPYLPQDFVDLAGTEQLGVYFNNSVHENAIGARTVADAIWQAIDAGVTPTYLYFSDSSVLGTSSSDSGR